MTFFFVALYLAGVLTSWWGLMVFFTSPSWHWDTYSGQPKLEGGIDVSFCAAFVTLLINFCPVIWISSGICYLSLLWNHHRKGVPLPWPKISLPKLRKCPTLFKAKEIKLKYIDLALVLLLLVGLPGCQTANKIHPNLATKLVKQHPNLQHICDYVGGCENVKISCIRYDGQGNSDLRNKTFWLVETGNLGDGTWQSGGGVAENDHLNTNQTIEDAIEAYWYWWRLQQTEEPVHTVYPNGTPCDKDCGL